MQFKVHVSRRAKALCQNYTPKNTSCRTSQITQTIGKPLPKYKGLKMYKGHGKPENCLNTFACQQQVTPYRLTKHIACRQQVTPYTLTKHIACRQQVTPYTLLKHIACQQQVTLICLAIALVSGEILSEKMCF